MPRGIYNRKNVIQLSDLDKKFKIIDENGILSKIEFKCELCGNNTITSLKNLRRRIKEKREFLCKSCGISGNRNPMWNKNPYGELSEEKLIEIKKSKSYWAKKRKLNEIGYKASHKKNDKMSKIHFKVIELLNKNNVKSYFDTEFPLGRYFFDEGSVELKKIIEINGDYWHANPEIYNENQLITGSWRSYTAKAKWEYDKKRIEFANEEGYEVLILWENEINHDIINIEEKIKKFIY